MRAVYVLEETARKEEITIQDEDVAGELSQIAARNGASLEEVAEGLRDQPAAEDDAASVG